MILDQNGDDLSRLCDAVRRHIEQPVPETEPFFSDIYRRLKEEPDRVRGELIDALIDVTKFFLLRQRLSVALDLSYFVLDRARRCGDKHGIMKALRLSGWVCNVCGMPEAITHLAEEIRLSREAASTLDELAGWNLLGTALLGVGEPSAAVASFRRALELSEGQVGAEPYRLAALCNLTTTLALEVGAKEAIPVARQLEGALDLLPAPEGFEARDQRAMFHLVLAEAFALAEEIVAAQGHVHAAKLLCDLPDQRARVALLPVEVLVELSSGASPDLEAIDRIVSSTHEVGALRTMALAYEKAGRLEAALRVLRVIMECSRRDRLAKVKFIDQVLQDRAIVAESGAATMERVQDSAVRLEVAVQERVQTLIQTAINASFVAGHDLCRVFRVSKLAQLFAEAEGHPASRVEEIGLAGKLFDIGTIVMPEPLLRASRSLSMAEQKILSDHARFGAELLASVQLECVQKCVDVARFHHERWDGSGQQTLAGEAIPIDARLVTLCDAFDAMTQRRPWRDRLSEEDALFQIGRDMGTRFDPDMARRFVCFVQALMHQHTSLSQFLSSDAREDAYVRIREQLSVVMRVKEQATGVPETRISPPFADW